MKETFSVRRQALVDEVELVYVRASCSENGDLKKSIIWKRFTCDKADYPGQRRSQCVFWLRLQSVAQKTYREHESLLFLVEVPTTMYAAWTAGRHSPGLAKGELKS